VEGMSQSRSLKLSTTNIATCPCQSINVHESFPVLARFVEEIADWDFPDGDTARALAIKVLPSTRPYLIIQYRESMRSSRRYRDTNNPHGAYRNVITKVETGVSTIRPVGALGVIIARLKPEAVSLLLGERPQCLADAKVDLGGVFDPRKVSLLEEMVSEAPTSFARIAAVAHFLSAHACPRQPDAVACQAAARLRRNPSLQVRRLAANLDVSERHLLRKFQIVFGVSPKQFARCARLEKVLAARSSGSGWADIAYGCGFADQAHMINDFNAVLGVPPEQALLPASLEQYSEVNTPNRSAISRLFRVVIHESQDGLNSAVRAGGRAVDDAIVRLHHRRGRLRRLRTR
jgi:AraC-like DNA-binding protein